MNHSTSKRTAKALPQVEATVLIEGTTAKIIPCTAKADFQVGNSQIKAGEKFYLVRSERRENRYYVVHYSSTRNTYQCSCGANMCDHDHLKTVRDHVMSHVVAPAAAEFSSQVEVAPMTVPATTQEVKEAKAIKEAREVIAKHDGRGPWTAEEYKLIMKADRARQRAWANEYRQQAAALAG
ncbi:MAG TPA: hypothetical protein VHV10_10905 [Ktedonobacteraceae bacterium]|jgi:hypothetical protein|nr:hypothetical protein [Ktedonobacteraceae bacterium]